LAVFTATAATDTNFAAVAGRLADVVPDIVSVGTCQTYGCYEVGFPEGALFDLPTPDFAPAAIQRISLRVDSLRFGYDPVLGPRVYWGFTITVEGTGGPTATRNATWGQVKAAHR
jgi:hypothetical protein